MSNEPVLSIFQSVFDNYSRPESILAALLPPLCDVLQSDRCFLYLRNPETQMGKIAFCWRRKPDVPHVGKEEWEREPDDLADEDPLFAASLRTDPSVYVEDVETAEPSVVNINFERENFGHRALIHSHLVQDKQLWGVLQPAVFGQPRVWTAADRAIVTPLETKLMPIVIEYVKAAGV
jgi:GAF domain-containing protein